MEEELLQYWQEVSSISINSANEIIADPSQPLLKVGMVRALKNFSETGDFSNIEPLLDSMVSLEFDIEDDDEQRFSNPYNN